MHEEEECQYCEQAFQTESKLVAHLSAAHSQEELSRIDRKRVDHYGQESRSLLRKLADDSRISRRAALATVGVGTLGTITGFGAGVSVQTGPEEIKTWGDLDAVRDNLSGNFVLVNDLDKDTTGYTGTGDDWTPIGTVSDSIGGEGTAGYSGTGDDSTPVGPNSSGFNGEFDGNGHTIADLTIDTTNSNVGLFGKIDSGGTVKDTVLKRVDVTGGGSFGEHIGGLFGYSNGTVRTSFVTGNVSSPSSSTTARVGGVGGRVGTDGTVTECGADVTVEATNSGGEIGGLLGQVWQGGIVEDSYATGDVTGGNDVGGLVGIVSPTDQGNKDEVRLCYATGDVTGSTSSTTGGLVGKNGSGTTGLVEKSYWDKGTTNRPDAIGTDSGDSNTLIGYGSTGDTEPASEMQGPEAETNMSELDFVSPDTWRTVEKSDTNAKENGYPILQSIDAEPQLQTQGIFQLTEAVDVSGNNATFSNVIIQNGN